MVSYGNVLGLYNQLPQMDINSVLQGMGRNPISYTRGEANPVSYTGQAVGPRPVMPKGAGGKRKPTKNPYQTYENFKGAPGYSGQPSPGFNPDNFGATLDSSYMPMNRNSTLQGLGITQRMPYDDYMGIMNNFNRLPLEFRQATGIADTPGQWGRGGGQTQPSLEFDEEITPITRPYQNPKMAPGGGMGSAQVLTRGIDGVMYSDAGKANQANDAVRNYFAEQGNPIPTLSRPAMTAAWGASGGAANQFNPDQYREALPEHSFGKNFGKKFAKTGQYGKKGLAQLQAAGQQGLASHQAAFDQWGSGLSSGDRERVAGLF